jgi:hypothetical protein
MLRMSREQVRLDAMRLEAAASTAVVWGIGWRQIQEQQW